MPSVTVICGRGEPDYLPFYRQRDWATSGLFLAPVGLIVPQSSLSIWSDFPGAPQILDYASGARMQINEIFKILDGRIRMVDNIG